MNGIVKNNNINTYNYDRYKRIINYIFGKNKNRNLIEIIGDDFFY